MDFKGLMKTGLKAAGVSDEQVESAEKMRTAAVAVANNADKDTIIAAASQAGDTAKKFGIGGAESKDADKKETSEDATTSTLKGILG